VAQKFGKWIIQKALDEGGQSHTFLVNEVGHEERGEFVLKRLKNKTRIARFAKEIEAVKTLSNPNVLRLEDFSLENDPPFLVAEYCAGGPLSKQDLSQKTILDRFRLFECICKGVAHAHSKSIIHRDLKPDNIFLRKDGTPVVGDWGICFLTDAGERLTITEEVMGPRYYMAPEVEDGKVQQVTARADVYSLGKLLYWILAGRIFARERHLDPEFDLTKETARAGPEIHLAYKLLDETIVSDPMKRPANASELLAKVEATVRRIEVRGHILNSGVPQQCIYCARGTYKLMVDCYEEILPNHQTSMVGKNELKYGFGIEHYYYDWRAGGRAPGEAASWLIFACDYCGNVQFFRTDLA
jgi:serine/threonine protein kinase